MMAPPRGRLPPHELLGKPANSREAACGCPCPACAVEEGTTATLPKGAGDARAAAPGAGAGAAATMRILGWSADSGSVVRLVDRPRSKVAGLGWPTVATMGGGDAAGAACSAASRKADVMAGTESVGCRTATSTFISDGPGSRLPAEPDNPAAAGPGAGAGAADSTLTACWDPEGGSCCA